MSVGKFFIRKKKSIDESIQAAIIKQHYRKQYSDILKFKSNDLPVEVTKQSIDTVWNKYLPVNPKWAQYYWSINSIASPYYIPSDIWFSRICRKLNSLEFFGWPQFQDKNYLDIVFRGVCQPGIIVRNIAGQFLDSGFNNIDIDRAIELCQCEKEIIIKPSISSKWGRGIEFVDTSQNGPDSLLLLLKNRGRNFVIQKVIQQHHNMAWLNADSINSIRIQTLLWNNQVHVLSSLVRIGVKGCRIDNPHSSNGVSCVLTPEGKMIQTAYDREWNPMDVLPNGSAPDGFEVPFYNRIIETVKKLQYRVPHSRLVGWDMTVSDDGEPILIEANLDYPEVYFHQIGKGPIISDPGLFDEIMSYVFHK